MSNLGVHLRDMFSATRTNVIPSDKRREGTAYMRNDCRRNRQIHLTETLEFSNELYAELDFRVSQRAENPSKHRER